MSRLLVALLVLVAACGSPGTSTNDAAPTDDAFVFPGTMTIRVRNDGTRTLYVQASGWSGQEVTSIVKPDGARVGNDTCEVCNCLSCPSCAVCGRTIARVEAIMPGAWLDFSWDQIDWSVIPDGCRPTLACEQPALVTPGPLTARAQYSDTFTTTNMFGADESFIGPSLHVEAGFLHPASDVVVVSIQ